MLGPLALGGGALTLPAFFHDHMVLQRETEAPVFGWARPRAEVTLRASWPGAKAKAVRAGMDGRFEFTLPTPPAGGPFVLRFESEGERVELADVLVGEVWLASGQSNMEWTLGPRVGNGVEGWEAAAKDAYDPFLRLFEVENTMAAEPALDVRGTWRSATPESAASFSAVAYFFARELRRELGVPVGLISAEWGGTPAEAWTSAAFLQKGGFSEFDLDLAKLARIERERATVEAEQERERAAYWVRVAEADARHGLAEAAAENFDVSSWSLVDMPRPWEAHGFADFDGTGWYRRVLSVPAEWSGQSVVVELGAIDDRDTFFWNGTRVGGYEDEGQWATPRRYVVPGSLVRGGANTLAVRVLDTGGYGGFSSGAESLRAFREAEASATLSLAGPWRFTPSTPLAEIGWPPSHELLNPGMPSVLWNGMVAPLVPFALRGVIWYQGEANRERAEQYERLFPTMIQAWRSAFRRELFFDFVQIAPFCY